MLGNVFTSYEISIVLIDTRGPNDHALEIEDVARELEKGR
jgi:hypothetical protein